MLRMTVFAASIALACVPGYVIADENVYRGNTERFIRLFNAHDAEALSQEYATDCSVIHAEEAVEEYRSRKEVAKALADFFAANPNVQIDQPFDKVDYRTLSDDTVIESGEFVLSNLSEEGESAPAMYSMIYKRDNDKWKIVYERTWPMEGSEGSSQQLGIGQQKMQVFDGLIGRWEGVKADGTPATPGIYRWVNNNSYIEFILGDYREVMGWDIKRGQYVSWGFGTHGGQGKFTWTNDGEGKWSWKSDQWCDRNGVDAVLRGSMQFDEEKLEVVFQYGNGPKEQLSLRKVSTD